jgi:hypothetical protein
MAHDSSTWRQERNTKLLEWFGDQSAVDFFIAISAICELWDDLTDRDKQPSQEEIDTVFWHTLVTLPTNSFFNEHKDFFMPLILQGINAWKDSVELEAGSVDDRAYALTLRYLGLQLAPMIVTVLHGEETARAMSVDCWRWFTQHDNALDWIKNNNKKNK